MKRFCVASPMNEHFGLLAKHAMQECGIEEGSLENVETRTAAADQASAQAQDMGSPGGQDCSVGAVMSVDLQKTITGHESSDAEHLGEGIQDDAGENVSVGVVASVEPAEALEADDAEDIGEEWVQETMRQRHQAARDRARNDGSRIVKPTRGRAKRSLGGK